MDFEADRIRSLPPYLFAEIQEKRKKLEADGVDVIDLGIGAPDLPPPEFVVEKLVEMVRNPENHKYPAYHGMQEFREAVAAFYQEQYSVQLDPDTEVLALIGSKEGIAHLIQSAVNPGETVILPNPGYPVYRAAVHLAGGTCKELPLDMQHGCTPMYAEISEQEYQQAKLMLLNYPGNPTAAGVSLDTFMKAVAIAKKHNLMVVNDAAYNQIAFNGYQSPSILQVPHAKKYAAEFGSLSKSYNMAGWRIGYVVGNKQLIRSLARLKSNIDSGQFIPIQYAAAAALKSDQSAVKRNNEIYEARMEKLHSSLAAAGIQSEKPKATIFLWARVPAGYTSLAFANKLLDEAGIIVTPGTAFGSLGEGFIRMALTVTEARLAEAGERLQRLKLKKVDK